MLCNAKALSYNMLSKHLEHYVPKFYKSPLFTIKIETDNNKKDRLSQHSVGDPFKHKCIKPATSKSLCFLSAGVT